MAGVELDRLGHCELLAGLTTEEVASVAQRGVVATYQRGDVIFEESSQSTDLFVLLQGRVSVEIQAPSGARPADEHLEIALLRAGDVFGEIAFLEGRRRSARVCAVDSVEVLRIDGPKLHALFEGNTGLGYRVLRNLASILAQRVVDVNFKWRQDRGAGAAPGATRQVG